MIITVLLVFLGVWYAQFRYRRQRLYQLAAKVPGPKGLPFIGHASDFTGDNEQIMTALQEYSYISMDLGGVMKAWLGHILYFVIVDPVESEVILKKCLEKDDLHRFMRKIIGNGVVFAPVAIWKRRRKVIIPAFSPKIVESFVKVFSEQSVILVQQLKAGVGKGAFDVWHHMSSYTLDSVAETVMGTKIGAQSNPDSLFLDALKNVLNLVCKRIFHLWLQPDWMFKLTPHFKEHEDSKCVLQEFTDDVIRNKRIQLKAKTCTKTGADREQDGLQSHQTFLDLLISLSGQEQSYTDLELREEVLTLTVAGTDTSAVAMSFTLLMLGKHQDVQEKVYEELREVYGDSDRPLMKEDLPKLGYLERVIKETLRLYPPVPFIIRKVIDEVHLPSGKILPAGCGVVVSIWGTHRNPKFWGADAEQFRPDRFLPDRLNLLHPQAYMPFSSGPRNCPGYQYAMMSAKTALSTILRQYRVLEPPTGPTEPNIRVKLDVMMKAAKGYHIILQERRTNPQNTS